MSYYENGGLKNQLAPRNNNPRLNKCLFVINTILALCALGIGIAFLYHKEMSTAIAMLLVTIICTFNAITAWRVLHGKKI